MNTQFLKSLRLPFLFLAAIWAVHLISFILPFDLKFLGVYPRVISGLKGVVFSPFIHADWSHLLSNSTPLFVLSAIVITFYKRVAIPAFSLIYLLSGLAVWLFARPAYHIGASGFIYGLVAFVFFTGVFRKNIKSIALALIVVFYYGSMIFGILPLQEEISWEGHLFGALAGILASWIYMNNIEKDEKKPVYSWELEPEQPRESFLSSNTFEKTKNEREQEELFSKGFNDWTTTNT